MKSQWGTNQGRSLLNGLARWHCQGRQQHLFAAWTDLKWNHESVIMLIDETFTGRGGFPVINTVTCCRRKTALPLLDVTAHNEPCHIADVQTEQPEKCKAGKLHYCFICTLFHARRLLARVKYDIVFGRQAKPGQGRIPKPGYVLWRPAPRSASNHLLHVAI